MIIFFCTKVIVPRLTTALLDCRVQIIFKRLLSLYVDMLAKKDCDNIQKDSTTKNYN